MINIRVGGCAAFEPDCSTHGNMVRAHTKRSEEAQSLLWGNENRVDVLQANLCMMVVWGARLLQLAIVIERLRQSAPHKSRRTCSSAEGLTDRVSEIMKRECVAIDP